jgi:hypothetical protein
MGDDPTSNCVRGCLACIFKRKGNLAPDQKEHALCIDHCVPWYRKNTFYSKLDVTIHCCAKQFGVIVGQGTGNEPGPVTTPGEPAVFDCDGCGAGPTRKMNCNVTKWGFGGDWKDARGWKSSSLAAGDKGNRIIFVSSGDRDRIGPWYYGNFNSTISLKNKTGGK